MDHIFECGIESSLVIVRLIKYNKRKKKRSDQVKLQKPLHQQKYQKGKVTIQTTPQQQFDYTAIADRPRIASLSNKGHPTGVVTGPTFPHPATTV